MFDAGPHSLLMGSYPNCPLPRHFRSSQMGVPYPRRSEGEGPKSRVEIILFGFGNFFIGMAAGEQDSSRYFSLHNDTYVTPSRFKNTE